MSTVLRVEFPFFTSTSVPAVPSAVQMASLVSEDPHHQTPHTPDTVAPTDLNETATELADWLLLITQMLKSNIVTVGDTEEIRTTMGRLQVRNWEQKRTHRREVCLNIFNGPVHEMQIQSYKLYSLSDCVCVHLCLVLAGDEE